MIARGWIFRSRPWKRMTISWPRCARRPASTAASGGGRLFSASRMASIPGAEGEAASSASSVATAPATSPAANRAAASGSPGEAGAGTSPPPGAGASSAVALAVAAGRTGTASPAAGGWVAVGASFGTAAGNAGATDGCSPGAAARNRRESRSGSPMSTTRAGGSASGLPRRSLANHRNQSIRSSQSANVLPPRTGVRRSRSAVVRGPFRPAAATRTGAACPA